MLKYKNIFSNIWLFQLLFLPLQTQNNNTKCMDKKSDVRIVGFPKENYDKEWLDTLNDRQKSDTALADGYTIILEDLQDVQDNVLNSPLKECLTSHWWYFLHD